MVAGDFMTTQVQGRPELGACSNRCEIGSGPDRQQQME